MGPVVYDRKRLDAAGDKEIAEAYYWLCGFKGAYVDAVVAAENLVPPERWKFYELHEVKGTWEQNNLAQCKSEMRNAWKSRPSILKKNEQKKPQKASK